MTQCPHVSSSRGSFHCAKNSWGGRKGGRGAGASISGLLLQVLLKQQASPPPPFQMPAGLRKAKAALSGQYSLLVELEGSSLLFPRSDVAEGEAAGFAPLTRTSGTAEQGHLGQCTCVFSPSSWAGSGFPPAQGSESGPLLNRGEDQLLFCTGVRVNSFSV